MTNRITAFLLLCGLCMALGLLMPALAGLAAAPLPAGDGRFDVRVLHWNQTLDKITRDLARDGITRSRITPLSDRLSVVQSSALAARDRASLGADEQRRLLDALGPKPGDNEPAESEQIAETRTAILHNLGSFDEQQKRSELALARIDLLFARMAEAEFRALTRVLTERTEFPLESATLKAGLWQVGQRLLELKLAFQAGWSSISAAQLEAPRLLLSVVVLCVGGVITLVLRRRLLARYGYRTGSGAPSLGRRLLAFATVTVANVLLPVVAVATLWVAMRLFRPLPETLEIVADLVLFALLNAVIVIGLAAAALTPTRPDWRIIAFSDTAALSLYRAVRWFVWLRLAAITVLVVVSRPQDSTERFFEESISAFFAADPNLHSVLGLLALFIVACALLNVLRPQNWRFRADAGDLTEPAGLADRPPSQWLRTALLLVRCVLILALLLGAFGYLYAGMYLADRVGFTLALVSLAVLLRTLAAEGLRYLTATERRVGRQLRRHLVFDEGGAARLIFWLMLLLDAVLVTAVAVLLALRWGVPQAEFWRLAAVLVRGVDIGSYTLSLIDVATAAAAFLVLLTLVRLLQGFLTNRVLPQTRLDVGARDALATGFGYVGLVIAALVAVSMLGLDLSQLALILGALSVGIGFGLQHVVSNFVAGLILLIQRPIKSGDWIVVGNGAYQGYVKHVNVTSTEIHTFDNASVLVPNSNLLTNEVLNWTHKNTLGRVILAVRVAYGSDPVQVRSLLLDCAKAHPLVLPRPEPVVLLQDFGPSSLDFELRFFLREIDTLLEVGSELRFAVLAALDEAGIEIPFPQHDVHLRNATSGPKRLSRETGWTEADDTP